MSVTRSDGVVGPALRVGLAVALILTGAGLLGHRDLAGFAALGAVAAAFGRPPGHRERATKVAFAGATLLVVSLCGGLLGAAGAPAILLIATLSVLVGVCAAVLNAFGVAGPGAVVMAFAATASAGFAHALPDVAIVGAATGVGALIGWMCSMITALLRRPSLSATPATFLRTGVRRLRSHPVWTNAARITLAAMVSGWVALAVGFQHPLWASMGAVAALQGVAYEHTVRRGIQRLLGNVAGAVVAAGLIALSLGYWQAAVLIVALQVAAELTVPANYALTSAAIAPMALLLMGLGAPLGTEAAAARAGDTLIGVVIGIVVAALTIEHADADLLPARRGLVQATN
ncbi:FUSC family protein [Aldersonia kunmingensis]|uniref:FUSC family protein n=1 Tax=Aldersonia kunmingensis TaxID=408066 RepID=UPI001FE093D5|nr:FUSC family protein [Aldersonia kunmingensis]